MIYINDNIQAINLDVAMGLLSEQRRQQAMKFKHEQGKRLCVAAYLLLREALKREYGIEEPPVFGYEEGGKPYIENHREIHFNLSHCRQAAVCVVSDQPVGIDVESIREYKEDLARYTMNDEEMQQILSSNRPDVEFIRLWTMKESWLKLTGEGLRDDLKKLPLHSQKFETVVNIEKGYVYTVCR